MCVGRRKDVNIERKGAKRKRERDENNRKNEVNKDVEREEGRI
jgi:hypothetical protein